MKTLKRILITCILLAILWFLYWTISPFFKNTVVQEDLMMMTTNMSTTTQPVLLSTGTFVGFDKIHNGTGTVSIYEVDGKKIVRFEEGFKVNNGPDLYVGFGKSGTYTKGSEISKLKGNIGSQNYELSADIDLSQYDSVWVWCKAFNTPFIKAELISLKN
jgi:hypothetical protein